MYTECFTIFHVFSVEVSCQCNCCFSSVEVSCTWTDFSYALQSYTGNLTPGRVYWALFRMHRVGKAVTLRTRIVASSFEK